jgi:uncharacterized metal-binding protein YceD (DUF177 family)
MGAAAPVEFSRPVALDRATPVPHERELVANEAELAALTRRLGLLSLDRLQARLSWWRRENGVVCLEGEFEAALSQRCVATLEPVATTVADRFVRRFMRGAPAAVAGEVVVDAEAEDPPEPLGDGLIDVGEIVAEELAMAIDPYPRAPDGELPGQAGGEATAGQAAAAANPFRVLAGLKAKR